jgi:hypothetical protein
MPGVMEEKSHKPVPSVESMINKIVSRRHLSIKCPLSTNISFIYYQPPESRGDVPEIFLPVRRIMGDKSSPDRTIQVNLLHNILLIQHNRNNGSI